QKVLIVRGESGRELMADGLRAAGVIVATVPAYRRSVPVLTEALAQQLRTLLQGDNDWIITSSEALRALVALVAQLDDPALVEKMRHPHRIVPH
ncbi:uroporphyrinogen III synthase, partial [Massilia sp. CCM 8733]